MHSLKSTAIAVVLLAVSIGLYQVSSTEDTTTGTDLTTHLTLPMPGNQATGFGQPAQPMPFQQNNPAGPQQNLQPQVHMNMQANSAMNQPYNGQFANRQPANPPSNQPLDRYPAMSSPSMQAAPVQQNWQAQSPALRSAELPISNGTSNAQSPNASFASFGNLASNPSQPRTQNQTQPLAAPALAASNSAQPSLTAPSFDDLRKSYDQATSTASNSISDSFDSMKDTVNDSVSNLVDQSRNRAANAVQSAQNQLASAVNGAQSSLQQNLSQATSAVRQPLSTDRDQGLINALQSEFQTMADDAPNLSSATESATQDAVARLPESNSFNATNDFMPNLNSATAASPKAIEADSEFTAQPIGSSNDSVNSLASGQRNSDLDLDKVQLANLAPESINQPAAQAPSNIDEAWSKVDAMVAEKDFRGALALLTKYNRRKDLTTTQRQRLNDWLDALAGKVIYSAEHHFSQQPYIIRSGETLNDIASRWGVPAQVVYNINRQQLGNKPTIVAGTELKTIDGPFHAEINLNTKTLTLYLKDLYAGRFPVRVGISGNPAPGQFRAVAKAVQGHTWRDADGNDFPPESSENGYGPFWIGMTGSLCMHAISDDTPEGHNGCIGLREKDARDIYGILSKGSAIKIVQ